MVSVCGGGGAPSRGLVCAISAPCRLRGDTGRYRPFCSVYLNPVLMRVEYVGPFRREHKPYGSCSLACTATAALCGQRDFDCRSRQVAPQEYISAWPLLRPHYVR